MPQCPQFPRPSSRAGGGRPHMSKGGLNMTSQHCNAITIAVGCGMGDYQCTKAVGRPPFFLIRNKSFY